MLNRLVGPTARWSLAALATTIATVVLVMVTAVQWTALRPATAGGIAALLTPLVVCSTLTYAFIRVAVKMRAKNIMEVFRRFQAGELHETDPVLSATDPEFRESRALFLQLARRLKEASAALAQRDAERRRLFSDVVHEIGTPVSSLLGLAEAMERADLTRTAEQRARIARAVAHESERLARFVEDLRDVAQLDDPAMALSFEPVDLAALVRDVVDRLNTIPDATPVQLEASSAEVRGDPVRLEQIVVNLVTNARRHAPPQAPIRVTVGARDGGATLRVDDGGPGVADADLAKLGERMRRLDKSRTRKTGGSGLGLTIVGAIAERHGGAVRYRRSDLGGLAVEVELRGEIAARASPE